MNAEHCIPTTAAAPLCHVRRRCNFGNECGAKAITLRVGWSALAVVVVALVLRPLLPWLALSLILYFIWQRRR